ncbi:hypothetical protein [Thiomicrospira pelophila]|nr:hypothetical protein [Thiomicrospira pelophila]
MKVEVLSWTKCAWGDYPYGKIKEKTLKRINKLITDAMRSLLLNMPDN